MEYAYQIPDRGLYIKTADQELKWVVDLDGDVFFESPQAPVPNHLALLEQHKGTEWLRSIYDDPNEVPLGIQGTIRDGTVHVDGYVTNEPGNPIPKAYDPTGSIVGAFRIRDAVNRVYAKAEELGIPTNTHYTVPKVVPGEGVRQVQRPYVATLDLPEIPEWEGEPPEFPIEQTFKVGDKVRVKPEDLHDSPQMTGVDGTVVNIKSEDDTQPTYVVEWNHPDDPGFITLEYGYTIVPLKTDVSQQDLDKWPDTLPASMSSLQGTFFDTITGEEVKFHELGHEPKGETGEFWELQGNDGRTFKLYENKNVVDDVGNVVGQFDPYARTAMRGVPDAKTEFDKFVTDVMQLAGVTRVSVDENDYIRQWLLEQTRGVVPEKYTTSWGKGLRITKDYEQLANQLADQLAATTLAQKNQITQQDMRQDYINENFNGITAAANSFEYLLPPRGIHGRTHSRMRDEGLKASLTYPAGLVSSHPDPFTSNLPSRSLLDDQMITADHMFEHGKSVEGVPVIVETDDDPERVRAVLDEQGGRISSWKRSDANFEKDDELPDNEREALKCPRCGSHTLRAFPPEGTTATMKCLTCGKEFEREVRPNPEASFKEAMRPDYETPDEVDLLRSDVIKALGLSRTSVEQNDRINNLIAATTNEILGGKLPHRGLQSQSYTTLVDLIKEMYKESITRAEGEEELTDFTLNDLGVPPEAEDYYRDASLQKEAPGKEHMKGVSPKRNRQYEHILESCRSEHPEWPEERCKELAARTVNKQRAEKGETKSSVDCGCDDKTSAESHTPGTRVEVTHPTNKGQRGSIVKHKGTDTATGEDTYDVLFDNGKKGEGLRGSDFKRIKSAYVDNSNLPDSTSKYSYETMVFEADFDDEHLGDEYGDDFATDEPPCPMCGGPGVPLGQLGRLMHYRCRNCGMTFDTPAEHSAAAKEGVGMTPGMGQQPPGYVPGIPGPTQNSDLPVQCPQCGAVAMYSGVCRNCGYQENAIQNPQNAAGRFSKRVDSTGSDLAEGQWYVMHSQTYKVPDVIQIVKLDDDKIVAHFESDMEGKFPLQIESSEAEKYSFDPYKHDKDPVVIDEHAQREARRNFSPHEQQELINENLDGRARNFDKLNLAGTHYETSPSYELSDPNFLWGM